MEIGKIERIGVREAPIPKLPTQAPAPAPARRELTPAPAEPARREREEVPA